MTPQLVAKIKQLVAGALVIGPPPQKSPSLADYPHCDQAVQQVAAELWGPCDGKTVVEHVFGRGRVFWGRSPEDVLKKIGLRPRLPRPARNPLDPSPDRRRDRHLFRCQQQPAGHDERLHIPGRRQAAGVLAA